MAASRRPPARDALQCTPPGTGPSPAAFVTQPGTRALHKSPGTVPHGQTRPQPPRRGPASRPVATARAEDTGRRLLPAPRVRSLAATHKSNQDNAVPAGEHIQGTPLMLGLPGPFWGTRGCHG